MRLEMLCDSADVHLRKKKSSCVIYHLINMYQIMHFVFFCLTLQVYLKNHKDWHKNHRIERPVFIFCYVIAEIHEIEERATGQLCSLISIFPHELCSRILTKFCDNFVQSGHGFKKLLIILSLQLHLHVF